MKPQVWVHDEPPEPEKVEPIKNSEDSAPKKPIGGLWTSSLIEKDNGDVSSGWIEWMQGEHYSMVKDPQYWVLKPKDDIKVYTIDTVEDAMEIMKPDPRYQGMTIEEYVIDWAQVFGIDDYDAIHLTADGQWRTRFPSKCYIEDGDRKWGRGQRTGLRAYSLYGWDCECTLWEGWQFEEVEYGGEVEMPEPEYMDA